MKSLQYGNACVRSACVVACLCACVVMRANGRTFVFISKTLLVVLSACQNQFLDNYITVGDDFTHIM